MAILLNLIKPNPENPRIIKDDKFEKLRQSIREFPQMMELRPIIVDKKGIILGGNMRYEALKAEGYEEVPDEWVKWTDQLTPAQIREFIIKDNVGFGEWNWEQLANEWDGAQLESWGLDVPNFDEEEDEEPVLSTSTKYELIVKCNSMTEQQEAFDLLAEKGYNVTKSNG